MDSDVTASIVIPTFNRPEFLRKAVASALAALPDAGEVVVSDDGEVSAVETLADMAHPSLRITTTTGRTGAAANRNQAVREARGRVIFFLDDDDLIAPGYPNAVLNAARSEGAGWGFSGTVEHAADTSEPDSFPDAAPFEWRQSGTLRKRVTGLGCGFWIRRDLFLEIGGVREHLPVNEDTDFCIALLAAGHAPLVTEAAGVSLFRADDSLTGRADPATRAACFRAILDAHGAYLAGEPDGLRFVLHRYLKFAVRAGQYRAAFSAAVSNGSFAGRLGNLAVLVGHKVSVKRD